MPGYSDYVSIDAIIAVVGVDCTAIIQTITNQGNPVYIPSNDSMGPGWIFGDVDLGGSPNGRALKVLIT